VVLIITILVEEGILDTGISLFEEIKNKQPCFDLKETDLLLRGLYFYGPWM